MFSGKYVRMISSNMDTKKQYAGQEGNSSLRYTAFSMFQDAGEGEAGETWGTEEGCVSEETIVLKYSSIPSAML